MSEIQQRIEQVRNDREHGSRWLVRETIALLRDIAKDELIPPDERLSELWRAGVELAQARPAMAAIAGAVSRIVNAPGGLPGMALAASDLLAAYDTAPQRIASFACPALQGTLMTLSISGTVLSVLRACAATIERVIVLESRPRYEGRETAAELVRHGIAVTLITDAQADIFLPFSQAVVVGADSVLAEGGVLNKAGTALVAWAAHGHNVPFYALCETLKISPQHWKGDLSQLEEKEAEEVLARPIAGVSVRNFYFDYTPPQLVTGVITERGILNRQQIQQIASTLKPTSLSQ
ncbi:MAG TPA: translation initiation factor eIF-2B [Ktedonobacteraceae bacterium]|nr:translation initiation factor eIF-2B [Ktedonobacteraceae bacterium]